MKQLVISTILFCSLLLPVSVSAQSDIIAARKANFKQSGMAMRQMRTHIANADYEAIEKSAAQIAAWAEQMPEFFPVNSGPDSNKTSARAAIWDDFDTFTALAQNNHKAAMALGDAARNGDNAGIMAAVQSLGQTCGACHSKFKD